MAAVEPLEPASRRFTFTVKATVSLDAGVKVTMGITGHVSRAMLSRYSDRNGSGSAAGTGEQKLHVHGEGHGQLGCRCQGDHGHHWTRLARHALALFPRGEGSEAARPDEIASRHNAEDEKRRDDAEQRRKEVTPLAKLVS